MTNEGKYKTSRERANAFSAFCKRYKFCKSCPARVHDEHYNSDIITDMGMHCHFNWLALEYKDEEKPMPCPCCGKPAMVHEMPWPWNTEQHIKTYKVVCAGCGLGTGEEATPAKAVALWNRRAK